MLKGIQGAGGSPVIKYKAMSDEAGRKMKLDGRGPCKPCSRIWTFSQRQERITQSDQYQMRETPISLASAERVSGTCNWNCGGWAALPRGGLWLRQGIRTWLCISQLSFDLSQELVSVLDSTCEATAVLTSHLPANPFSGNSSGDLH